MVKKGVKINPLNKKKKKEIPPKKDWGLWIVNAVGEEVPLLIIPEKNKGDQFINGKKT